MQWPLQMQRCHVFMPAVKLVAQQLNTRFCCRSFPASR